MCASYGLQLAGGLEPMSTPASQALLTEWMDERGGQAKITGKNARNFNPIVRVIDGERVLELGWWWLHVGGVPAKFSAFNSRDDALLKRWRKPFQHRALLPADWYSEGGKRWTLPGGGVFAIAAITSPRIEEDGSEITSYSMVTRHGIGEASTVVSSRGESRMPLIIPAELHDDWLDPGRAGDESLVAEVQHASEEISREVTAKPPELEQPTLI